MDAGQKRQTLSNTALAVRLAKLKQIDRDCRLGRIDPDERYRMLNEMEDGLGDMVREREENAGRTL